MVQHAHITGQVIFLYYTDLAAPRKFYGSTLGLQTYYEQDWVTVYHTTRTASIGIVKVNRSSSKRPKSDTLMISISIKNVDTWYRHLKKDQSIKFLKDIYDHPNVPIRTFVIEDPGGYSVEYFQWLR